MRERKPVQATLPELETTSIEDLSRPGDKSGPADPAFQSDLDYLGYSSIEDCDNDAYCSRDLERGEDGPREIVITEREDLSELSELGEESPIDPQGNRS